MLPKKPIKEVLKQKCDASQISTEAVIEAREHLQEMMEVLSKQAAEEFEQLNRGREKQGISRRKRLNTLAVKQAAQKVFSPANNNDTGSRSKPPQVGSPGGTMSAQTEAAKPDTTDDQREVA